MFSEVCVSDLLTGRCGLPHGLCQGWVCCPPHGLCQGWICCPPPSMCQGWVCCPPHGLCGVDLWFSLSSTHNSLATHVLCHAWPHHTCPLCMPPAIHALTPLPCTPPTTHVPCHTHSLAMQDPTMQPSTHVPCYTCSSATHALYQSHHLPHIPPATHAHLTTHTPLFCGQ